ncbi:MAG: hypothetical protein IKG27_00985 [Bacilli bacterium]|nr:hypothetical protein [Bacilli bacterium]
MTYLYTFIFCFIIIYLFYFVIIINRKKGLETLKKGKQIEFFKKAYNLDFNKINIKKFANSLGLTNAFIMALTITIIEVFNNLIIKLLVGFVILIPLMLIMYKLLGLMYKKEGK